MFTLAIPKWLISMSNQSDPLGTENGPDVNYGNGPYIWVDNLDNAEGTLAYFRAFLEDINLNKVWHNYSFDRHVLFNHGINAKGLHGDTMHMARLWNTARFKRGGYSLQALTSDLLLQRKKTMKELFGIPKPRKDGSPGKEKVISNVADLQRFPEFRKRWIRYSVFDAESTWFLHRVLRHKLQRTHWIEDADVLTGQQVNRSMYEFYLKYLVPFGECLTDIERKGMHVDREYLKRVEKTALDDRDRLERHVLNWVKRYCEEADRINVYSAAQKQQLLFAPYSDTHGKVILPAERSFEVENTEQHIEPGKQKPKKKRNITIRGFGLTPISFTASGLPAVTASVLEELAGNPTANPPRYGKAYNHFADKEEGAAACHALRALYEISSINTMLNSFILPLQELADSAGRVHCSLNLNTDTGRLSSRKPNLQNQPALEKDRYKIRDAFVAPKGKQLIVADYSQLELRLLAHITQCKAMIEAFRAGGDFHSRTAVAMYDHVAKAVESGEVLLEWDYTKNPSPPVPLLKEKFATERKNAKILNFSIAYGKTSFGLSKDFGVRRVEASKILEKWYGGRQEVRRWQEQAIDTARKFGYTRTLMGRYRRLPDAMLKSNSFTSRKAQSHAERAAVNTPIQGAAADLVMQAMLRINQNTDLRSMGWEMVCQIHDEIILEGPEVNAEQAKIIVKDLMENPFERSLSVDLQVDAKIDRSWYRAK
ncbi:unnamed protein product [Albugo candida]|uniref:DNA-directed DNA polymerase family A palm domain-containing protein n=1 Tax=Albugo candida TaxID=65357 RepID=A0A024GHP3_9STRA|nr:unnamed protein product [Albugo candida]|eukprot:CCI46021.1 unnamed protein product [Albugo candida]